MAEKIISAVCLALALVPYSSVAESLPPAQPGNGRKAEAPANVRCVQDAFGNLTCSDGTRVVRDSFGHMTVIPGRR